MGVAVVTGVLLLAGDDDGRLGRFLELAACQVEAKQVLAVLRHVVVRSLQKSSKLQGQLIVSRRRHNVDGRVDGLLLLGAVLCCFREKLERLQK